MCSSICMDMFVHSYVCGTNVTFFFLFPGVVFGLREIVFVVVVDRILFLRLLCLSSNSLVSGFALFCRLSCLFLLILFFFLLLFLLVFLFGLFISLFFLLFLFFSSFIFFLLFHLLLLCFFLRIFFWSFWFGGFSWFWLLLLWFLFFWFCWLWFLLFRLLWFSGLCRLWLFFFRLLWFSRLCGLCWLSGLGCLWLGSISRLRRFNWRFRSRLGCLSHLGLHSRRLWSRLRSLTLRLILTLLLRLSRSSLWISPNCPNNMLNKMPKPILVLLLLNILNFIWLSLNCCNYYTNEDNYLLYF